jgi:phosphatidylglycerol:prolipoprotein diacylglycerol transferase
MLVDALAPGVWAGSWSALVSLGFVLGLSLQAVLAGVLGLGWAPLTGVTLVAGALGLVGAKGYYLLTHPVERRRSIRVPGMSVQGFVIVALATLAVGALLLSVPVGAVLDATAPGLFLGMTVGRLGCLFAGCCVGRPTASRWGLWSSDRHVGVRRIPVQLMESSLCAALTALSAIAVGTSPVAGSGLVLVVGFAAYLVGRQLLFPLRAVGRVTRNGRMVTLVVASAVLATGLVVMWSA